MTRLGSLDFVGVVGDLSIHDVESSFSIFGGRGGVEYDACSHSVGDPGCRETFVEDSDPSKGWNIL